MSKVLLTFIENEWEFDGVYDVRFFVDLFGDCHEDFKEPRKVRYTLNKLSEDGFICKVNDDYNIYYISTCWYNLFSDEFNKYEMCIT